MGNLVTLSLKLADAADSLELAEQRLVEANNRRTRAARGVIEASAGCEREIRTLQFETDAAQRAEQDLVVSARHLVVAWRHEKVLHERAEEEARVRALASARMEAPRG